jgi:GMP synthase-like glutamine amidotransferase
MRVHYLQHVPFEGLGTIEGTLRARGARIHSTRLYAGERLPALDEFDALVVLGGPMSVHDEAQLPWLTAEKHFVKAAVQAGKRVLGICLGAQILAEVLGGQVTKNAYREIGWFPITKRIECNTSALANAFPDEVLVFHWHGETFSVPDGAQLLASSTGCRNQGFVWNDRVLALQFHLESTQQGVRDLISHCADELDGTRYVQTAKTILAADRAHYTTINALMDTMLRRWLA